MTKKRILITGGAGFIGSHLCEHFLRQGHKVLAVDNMRTGSSANVKLLNKYKNFSFRRWDICDKTKWKGPIDLILNAASPASPVDYLRHPFDTMRVGSYGTHNMLDLAVEKHATIIQFSTSEVYGDPLCTGPQQESYWGNVNPIGPRSVYDEAKRFSEAMTSHYRRDPKINIDAKIIRIFNTYGPRMRPKDGRVIPNFISQALLGKSITIYGNGSQTRSYCYVTDLVDGIEKMAFSKEAGPINLGNPNEMTVSELAKMIVKLTGSKSKIVYRPLPEDDPKRRCPYIALAKKKLGWTPKVALKDGLAETIEYFRALKK